MRASRYVALASLVVLVACRRDREPEPAPPRVEASPAAAPAGLPVPRFPLGQRLVAIGDLHGDLQATRAALKLAGAIGEGDRWQGEKLVVVQTGDQLDRGDDDREVLDLLEELSKQASKAGGALHVLNGNHETMNVSGDFRYVSAAGFRAFDSFATTGVLSRPELGRFSEAERGRAAAFLPGGVYARKLAERNTVLVLGDSVFVHGGVLPEHVRYGLERINDEIRRFMLGELPQLPELLLRPDSPIWTRAFSEAPLNAQACATLKSVLDALGVRRMIVGHTVQTEINSACDERVWRIDVGLSKAYGGPIEVLEIHGGRARPVRGRRRMRSWL